MGESGIVAIDRQVRARHALVLARAGMRRRQQPLARVGWASRLGGGDRWRMALRCGVPGLDVAAAVSW